MLQESAEKQLRTHYADSSWLGSGPYHVVLHPSISSQNIDAQFHNCVVSHKLNKVFIGSSVLSTSQELPDDGYLPSFALGGQINRRVGRRRRRDAHRLVETLDSHEHQKHDTSRKSAHSRDLVADFHRLAIEDSFFRDSLEETLWFAHEYFEKLKGFSKLTEMNVRLVPFFDSWVKGGDFPCISKFYRVQYREQLISAVKPSKARRLLLKAYVRTYDTHFAHSIRHYLAGKMKDVAQGRIFRFFMRCLGVDEYIEEAAGAALVKVDERINKMSTLANQHVATLSAAASAAAATHASSVAGLTQSVNSLQDPSLLTRMIGHLTRSFGSGIADLFKNVYDICKKYSGVLTITFAIVLLLGLGAGMPFLRSLFTFAGRTHIAPVIEQDVAQAFGFSIGKSDLFAWLKTSAEQIARCKTLVDSASYLWGKFLDLVDYCAVKLYGEPWTSRGKDKVGILDAIDKIIEVLSNYSPENQHSEVDDQSVVKAYANLMSYARRLVFNKELAPVLTGHITRFQSVYEHALGRLKTGKPRDTPLCVFISGPPGSGKSTMVSSVVESLFSFVHSKSPGPDDVYHWKQENEYQDTYDNQFSIVMDDIFQHVDPNMRALEAMSIIQIVNTVPYPLHAAQLEKKGVLFVTSPLLVCTSNDNEFKNVGITDVSALRRRFHVKIYTRNMTPEEELLVDVEVYVGMTNNVPHWHLYKNVNMRELEATLINAYQFYRVPATQTATKLSELTKDSFKQQVFTPPISGSFVLSAGFGKGVDYNLQNVPPPPPSQVLNAQPAPKNVPHSKKVWSKPPPGPAKPPSPAPQTGEKKPNGPSPKEVPTPVPPVKKEDTESFVHPDGSLDLDAELTPLLLPNKKKKKREILCEDEDIAQGKVHIKTPMGLEFEVDHGLGFFSNKKLVWDHFLDMATRPGYVQTFTPNCLPQMISVLGTDPVDRIVLPTETMRNTKVIRDGYYEYVGKVTKDWGDLNIKVTSLNGFGMDGLPQTESRQLNATYPFCPVTYILLYLEEMHPDKVKWTNRIPNFPRPVPVYSEPNWIEWFIDKSSYPTRAIWYGLILVGIVRFMTVVVKLIYNAVLAFASTIGIESEVPVGDDAQSSDKFISKVQKQRAKYVARQVQRANAPFKPDLAQMSLSQNAENQLVKILAQNVPLRVVYNGSGYSARILFLRGGLGVTCAHYFREKDGKLIDGEVLVTMGNETLKHSISDLVREKRILIEKKRDRAWILSTLIHVDDISKLLRSGEHVPENACTGYVDTQNTLENSTTASVELKNDISYGSIDGTLSCSDVLIADGIPGAPGDCGRAFFEKDESNLTLLGYHIAGRSTRSIVSRLSKEDWNEAFSYFHNNASVYSRAHLSGSQEPDVAHTRKCGMHKSWPVHSVLPKSYATPSDSGFTKSYLTDEEFGPSLFPELMRPALLRPRGEVSPLDEYAKNFVGKVSRDAFPHAEDPESWLGVFTPKTKTVPYKKFTFSQVVYEPRTVGLEPLDTSTSPGGKWSLNGVTRKMLLDVNHSAHKELIADVIRIEKALSAGEVPWEFHLLCPKDEPVSLEKVNSGRTRYFLIGSLSMQIVFRMYFGWFLVQQQAKRRESDIQVGINPYSQDWLELFLAFEDLCCSDSDIKKYDVNFPRRLAIMFPYMASLWWDNVPYFSMQLLLIGILQCRVLIGNVIVVMFLLPSGTLVTAYMNSVANSVAHRIISRVILVPLKPAVFGDDSIIGWKPLSKEENSAILDLIVKLRLTLFGWVSTSADKTGAPTVKSIEQCQFLKRGFVRENGVVLAPLERASIESRMLSWVQAKTEGEVRVKTTTNIRVAMMEASLHDKEYFEYLKTTIFPRWREVDPASFIPYSFETCRVKTAGLDPNLFF